MIFIVPLAVCLRSTTRSTAFLDRRTLEPSTLMVDLAELNYPNLERSSSDSAISLIIEIQHGRR